MVSKYIGETEKNLDRVFAAAEGSNAILFFDEADALFGKRSEVRDAHDRYANIEVAYLLQRMETYSGAVILATNLRHNLDDAFLRRLDVAVDFPFPEPEDRLRIWTRALPDRAPVADDVDLAFLAERFKLSGGGIRNASLAAAFLAAEDAGVIGMPHLVRAVAQEYAKLGRLTLETRLRALPRAGERERRRSAVVTSVLVEVPLTTALADLDEALRRLLVRELARHGFDGVKVAFDAPTKEWAAALSGPAVNLFLFDLRESRDYRTVEWRDEMRRRPRPRRAPAAAAGGELRRDGLDAGGRGRAPPALPGRRGALRASRAPGRRAQRRAAERRPAAHHQVGQPRDGGGADFWLAVGGQYKASVDYAVTVPVQAGTASVRGPETRSAHRPDRRDRRAARAGGGVAPGRRHRPRR